jgi:asparagine synthase (glutamine-hydrolysing)
MCGIIAIAGKTSEIKKETVEAMLQSIAQRGPDDRDFTYFGNCILGQTRLSFLDLAGGHQPMKDSEKNITIVFNGEIYNHQELRVELKKKGHAFVTTSDTEVILKAYIEYGKDCPRHLDGMFAFFIWDEDAEEAFLARDRFGKKPLYYTFTQDGKLYVASETKALFQAGIKGVIDPAVLDNYLTLMYIPPWKTVYKNIHTLPPAHSATYKDGKLTATRYWQLEDKQIQVPYEGAKNEIKKRFETAVERRMIADVEVGAFLSGGVDSTLVCTYAARHTSYKLKTFALGYGDHINELPFAQVAAEKIGTDHSTLQAREDLIHELEEVMTYLDEPNADSSLFPQHLLSAFAAKKVKAALSGDGADELFMGYGWYWKYWNTRKITRLKNFFFSNPFKEYIKNISIFKKDERAHLWKNTTVINDDIYEETVKKISGNGVKKINTFDLTTYLAGELLSKIDRTSMMHSLEVRSPFLDHKLAEYVYNLPEEYKMNKNGGKIILKDILTEFMPKEFVYRRKQGFGAPVAAWMKTEKIKAYLYEKLGSKAHIYSYFKEETVKKLLEDFYVAEDISVHYKIWSLLCLELWLSSHSKHHD